MADQGYRAPSFRSILAGIAVAIALIVLIGGLPLVVKLLGLPFMIIPSMLNLTQLVLPADVRTYDLSEPGGTLEIGRPGLYAVYVEDWDLLEMTESTLQPNAPPWLVVRSQADGKQLPVTHVRRGLRPYDTPFAPGRPIFTIQVANFGVYELTHPDRPARLAVVPDHVTGREGIIALAMGLEVLLALLPFLLVFGRRHYLQSSRARAAQAAKRREADEFWERRAAGSGRR